MSLLSLLKTIGHELSSMFCIYDYLLTFKVVFYRSKIVPIYLRNVETSGIGDAAEDDNYNL